MTLRTSGCHLETLALGAGTSVQRCTHCGVLVVHVGCLSLRLDESAFELLVETLTEARRTRVCTRHSGRVHPSRIS